MALLAKFLGYYHSFHRTPPPPHTFWGLLHFSRKLQLFSLDSTAPTHILGTLPLLLRHSEHNPVRLTAGHKNTPPIWMGKTPSLYGFISEISRILPLFSPDSTAPTHILGTPPLFSEITTLFTGLHRPHTHSGDSSTFTEAQRTQPSPFDRRTQGHTPNMDGQDSKFYGFISEISRILPLFSPDSTFPTHILGTPPLLLRHNEPNPVRSTTGHTPLNGLNLAQLSNFLAHLLLDKWDKKPHPSHYTRVPFSICT